MKKIFIAAMVATLIHAAPLLAEGQTTQTVKVKIEGMTCSMCAAKIKSQWSSLCSQSSVDLKGKEGSCSFDPSKTKPEDIVNAVNEAGFKGTLVKE